MNNIKEEHVATLINTLYFSGRNVIKKHSKRDVILLPSISFQNLHVYSLNIRRLLLYYNNKRRIFNEYT